MNYYGKLDLTKLVAYYEAHRDKVQQVQFKDGVHELIDIDVRDRKAVDEHGNAAYIKVSDKNIKEGISPYIGDLKVSKFQQGQSDSASFMEAFR